MRVRPAKVAAAISESAIERVCKRLEIVEHGYFFQAQRVPQLRQVDGPGKVVVHNLVAHDLARACEHAVLDGHIDTDKGLQQVRQRRELRACEYPVAERFDPAGPTERGAHQRNTRVRAAYVGCQKRHVGPPRQSIRMVDCHVQRAPSQWN
jgi:hypothetical protein